MNNNTVQILNRFCKFIVDSMPAENDNDIVSKLFPEGGKLVAHFLSFFRILQFARGQSDIRRRLYTKIGDTFIQQYKKNIADTGNLFTSLKYAIQVLYKIRSSIQDPEKNRYFLA